MDLTKFRYPKDNTWRAILTEANTKIAPISKLCKNHNLVIQAGGNAGVFPAYLSDIFETVVTFEPCSTTYKYLEENLKDYSNIYCYPYGLGDIHIHVSMKEDRKNCGANQLLYDKEGDIPVVCIDNIMLVDGFKHCDLIYLDIEGGEWKAVSGASYTIQNHRPVVVLENKGLIPEYKNTGLEGNQELRDDFCYQYNYTYYGRMMRDDIFIPNEN